MDANHDYGAVPKRKADAELNGAANGHDAKRYKPSVSPQPEVPSTADGHTTKAPSEPPKPAVPFPEKPAVIEERNGEISFQVVNNDNSARSMIILTGLKCIFQKQLPKMPKDYIARLVYDRTHLSSNRQAASCRQLRRSLKYAW